MDLLLAYDVDLMAQDVMGNTALHYAVTSGTYESAFKLMSNRNFNDQNFTVRNNDQDTPVILAVRLKSLPVL